MGAEIRSKVRMDPVKIRILPIVTAKLGKKLSRLKGQGSSAMIIN